MEHINSVWNSGEPASAVNSPGKGTPIGKDNFHCTFFRQPKPLCAKNYSPELSNQYPVSPNLFDTCTDSDSELDELANAEQWLQMPSCSNHCTTGKPTSQPGKRVFGKPVVTFGGTSCSRSETPVKSCIRKRSIIRGTTGDNASTKVARFGKRRNYLGPKIDQKVKHLEKLNKTPNSSHRQHGNPMAHNDNVFLPERTNNSELMRALSDVRSVLHGTKTNPTNVALSNEAIAKKRKPMESRIVRNKRLLMSMKNVIRAMKVQEAAEGPGLESLQSIEASNKVAETNLATVEDHEDRGESLSGDRIEEEMRMPIFMKPELEKLLNDSMRRAVEKYRISGNTWEKLKQEKLLPRNSPELKNPASCLLLENHFPS